MTPRIALVNPLGDPGIGTYTHELAEAIVGLGGEADVFTTPGAWARALPRRHRLFPVTGSALLRQRAAIAAAGRESFAPSTGAAAHADPHATTVRPTRIPGVLKRALRTSYLSIEFALWLRARGYDVLWTQWPESARRSLSLWSAARAVGLHVVHTAHNVFPHEMSAIDHRASRHAYRWAHRIVVHSRMAADALADEFPFAREKLVVAPHGLYTTYPSVPEGRRRIRERLGVAPSSTLALFFGGIRPYKNVDAVVSALRADTSHRIELLVAGHESGYPDADPTRPLARTRRLVNEAGVAARVHFMEGPFGYAATAEVFEAADVVLLPYLESWGSGLLLLAMSFGKPVIVTRTGGMEEYVERYPASIVLDAPTPEAVLAALHLTRARAASDAPAAERPAAFEWPRIVSTLLPRIMP